MTDLLHRAIEALRRAKPSVLFEADALVKLKNYGAARTIAIVGAILFFIAVCAWMISEHHDCEQRGGVLVRTVTGLVCLRVEKAKP